jgi:acetyl/propionyl-CoA carboxylase alpha subunit
MGDKGGSSHESHAKAKGATLPGTEDPVEDRKEGAEAAANIWLSAHHQGGVWRWRRGMRVGAKGGEISMLCSMRRRAKRARFWYSAVLFERYIGRAKHNEGAVLGDGTATWVNLHEARLLGAAAGTRRWWKSRRSYG